MMFPREKPLSLQAIFFDFDGVILDLEPLHYASWEKTAKEYHSSLSVNFSNSLGHADIFFAHLLKQQLPALSSVTINSLIEKKERYFFMSLDKKIHDTKKERQVIEKLSHFYRLGIVSSSRRMLIRKILDRQKLSSYFSVIIGMEQVLTHKPDPAPYLRALADLHISPREALAVEDSEVGLESATRAGIYVLHYKQFIPHPSVYQHLFPSVQNFSELLSVIQHNWGREKD